MSVRLGRCGLRQVALHRQTPRLADHMPIPPPLAAAQGAPQPVVPRGFYRSVADFPMCLNDRLGTCPIAGVAHALQVWGAVAGRERIMTNAAVARIYRTVGGYNPADPTTDRGLAMSDLLEHWRIRGVDVGDGGEPHRLDAYAAVDPQDLDQMAAVVDLCGVNYAGFAWPRSAMAGGVLDVPPGGPVDDGAPGSEGGHMALIVGTGALWPIVTWGSVRYATDRFIRTYCFQAVALFSRSWLSERGTTIAGETLDQLEAAVAAIDAPAALRG